MAYATLTGTGSNGLSFIEGQSGDILLNFVDLQNASFSYSYSFSSGESASASDFFGGSGSGSMSFVSNIPQTESIPISFSAVDDNISEDTEAAILNVNLSGIQFLDGSASKAFEIDILNESRPTGDLEVIGSPVEDETLQVDFSNVDDSEGIVEDTVSYQWLRDGLAIDNANGETYTLGNDDGGTEISVRATFDDGLGVQESVLSAAQVVENINDEPQGQLTVEGEAVAGNTLTVNTSDLSDGDGIGPLSFQWLRNGTAISTATEESYTVTSQDIGSELSVEARYTDDGGTNEVASLPLGLITIATASEAGSLIVGSPVGDFIEGNFGNDTLTGEDGNDSISGGAGDDSLVGGEGDDILAGVDGADSIEGGLGDDLIGGGTGNDMISGGDDNDIIGAGQGNDTADGGAGDDIVNGGTGDDSLSGGSGNDTMGASQGNDDVLGGDGDDDIGGGTGSDAIDAGNGNDSVGGGEGNDSILGGNGSDFLAGGGRNDLISGGDGNDTINGGDGDDTMTGGDGADVFVFNFFKDGDNDVITDFADGSDSFLIRIDNPETGAVNIDNGGNGLQGYVDALNITDTADGTLMSIDGHTILVASVAATDLTLEDFAFL